MPTSARSTALPVDGWRRARRCGPNGGNCVEVNMTRNAVGVRDTKPAHSPILTFAPSGWRTFVSATTQGNMRA